MAVGGEARKNNLWYLSYCLIDVQDKELECEDSRAYRDEEYHYAIDSYGSFVGVIVDEVIRQAWLEQWKCKSMKFGLASNKDELERIYQQKCKEGFNGKMRVLVDFITLQIPRRFKKVSADDVGRSVRDALASKCGGTVEGGDGSVVYVLGESVKLDTKNFSITKCKMHLDCMTIKNKLFSQFTHCLSDLIESKIPKSLKFSEITRKDLNGKRLSLKVGKTNVEGSGIHRMKRSTWSAQGITSRWPDYEKEGYKGMVVIFVMTEDVVPECLRGFKTHEDIILEIEYLLSNKKQIDGCDLENQKGPRRPGQKKVKNDLPFASVLYIAYKHSGENLESVHLQVKDEEIREEQAPDPEGAAGLKADSDVDGLADLFATGMGINKPPAGIDGVGDDDGADVTPRGRDLPEPATETRGRSRSDIEERLRQNGFGHFADAVVRNGNTMIHCTLCDTYHVVSEKGGGVINLKKHLNTLRHQQNQNLSATPLS